MSDTKTLRIYFDPESDVNFSSTAVMNQLATQATHSLRRIKPDFRWSNADVNVYYYPGGLEDDPRYGKYQRGEGFYADISVAV